MHGNVEAKCTICKKEFLVHVLSGEKHMTVTFNGCECGERQFILFDIIPFLLEHRAAHTIHFDKKCDGHATEKKLPDNVIVWDRPGRFGNRGGGDA